MLGRQREPRDALRVGARLVPYSGPPRAHHDVDERLAESVSRGDAHDRRPAALEQSRGRRQRPAPDCGQRRRQRPDDAGNGRGDVVAVAGLLLLRADPDDVDHEADPDRLGDRRDRRGRAGGESAEVAGVGAARPLGGGQRDQPRAVRAGIVELEAVDVSRRDRRPVRYGHRPREPAPDADRRRRDGLRHGQVEERRRAWRRRRHRRRVRRRRVGRVGRPGGCGRGRTV